MTQVLEQTQATSPLRPRLRREGTDALQRVVRPQITDGVVAEFYLSIGWSCGAGVEQAIPSEDILGEYCANFPLDATELSSHVFIKAVCQVFAPPLEVRWIQEVMLIPYAVQQLKDGVPGVHPIVLGRLLEARELGYVVAKEGASLFLLIFEGTCPLCEAGESTIEDTLDVGVVFRVITPRVKISDMRM